MTREIKFRIRHFFNEEWLYYNVLDFEGMDATGGLGWAVNTIGQFTGLRDKNGREGYQKDVLGGLLAELYIDWCEKEASIEPFFNNGDCASCMGEVQWPEVVESIKDGTSWFIGNVHENPELLEPGNTTTA